MSPVVTFVIMLQAELLLIAIGIAVFFFMRYRKLISQKDDKPEEAPAEDSSPGQDVRELLQDKVKNTKDQLSHLADAEPEDDQRRQLLQKRIDYLEIELELLEQDETGEGFWNEFYNKISVLMPVSDDTTNIDSVTDMAQPQEFRTAIENQQQAIKKLMESLSDVEATADNIEEMEKTATVFERFARELTMCAATLKMENQRQNAEGNIQQSVDDHHGEDHQEQAQESDVEAETDINELSGNARTEDVGQETTEETQPSAKQQGFDLADDDLGIDELLNDIKTRED